MEPFTPTAGKEQTIFVLVFGVATPKIKTKEKQEPCPPQAKIDCLSESPEHDSNG